MTVLDDRDWLARAQRSADAVRVPDRGPLEGLELLPPHASSRRYARATWPGGSEIVLLEPPPDAPSDEVGGTEATDLERSPFVVVRGWLEARGLPVPSLYAIDVDEGALWLEDLGSMDFDQYANAHPKGLEAAYRHAVDLLVEMQRTLEVHDAPDIVTARRFGRDILRWELDHYVEWRLVAELAADLTPAWRDAAGLEFDRLADALAAAPTCVMHRDFQSHNLMVVPSQRRLVMLDFQDAMIGPAMYDAVALLRDSYVVLPNDVRDRLVRRWADAVADDPAPGGLDADALVALFHLQTVQRKLKDAGRFVYIDRVKHNPGFLGWIPDSLRYVRDAFDRLPAWSRLRELLAEVDPALRDAP